MAEPDYYMDLGVDSKASQQEIEKVYTGIPTELTRFFDLLKLFK
jgi:DnaJ-class molecular chaperone